MRIAGAVAAGLLVAVLVAAGTFIPSTPPAPPTPSIPPPPPPPPPSPPPRLVLPADLEALFVATPLADEGDEPLAPSAIVLHSTSGLTFARTMEELAKRKRSLHVLVDADGTAHRLRAFDRRARAARGMDDVALHVSAVGGVGTELVANEKQLAAVAKVVGALAAFFKIPVSNHDVVGRAGIFSHMQCKYRHGGLRRGEPKGRMEPGEDFVEAVLGRCGGEFYSEERWKSRTAEGWLFVLEEAGGGADRRRHSKGRDLTRAPAPALACVERVDGRLPEERRMKYLDRGKMPEIRGVVLHFTATDTYGEAVAAFESRKLGPQIIVDVDGKAYQVVDALDDLMVAAAGTNEHCIQVEIVGEGQEPLLKNNFQAAKVVEVLKELAALYKVPLTNGDIEERRGVFSHGQAKKRWGRSAWLWGRDFDPGEEYMKVVLEAAGGVYVVEEQWKGRSSGEWVIEPDDWLP